MTKDMFSSIAMLKKRLSPEGKIEVVHDAYSWTARFDWSLPNKNLSYNEEQNLHLPQDFVTFLKEVADGCVLFYDPDGQWGYKIYSYEELTSKQSFYKKIFAEKWSENFVAFAELCGEANALFFDLRVPSYDLASYAIRETSIDKSENWMIVCRSFHEWLDHLVTAQGGKYWEWK